MILPIIDSYMNYPTSFIVEMPPWKLITWRIAITAVISFSPRNSIKTLSRESASTASDNSFGSLPSSESWSEGFVSVPQTSKEA